MVYPTEELIRMATPPASTLAAAIAGSGEPYLVTTVGIATVRPQPPPAAPWRDSDGSIRYGEITSDPERGK